ncbi:winged helix-turn-helix domain-containing protein [Streptomyces sp. NBC_01174]|uniref:AfsR/SARP family transcriptional regulator n=1 Tax=Streptomyces sp. NBC_01174 TaxID=2903758 RepID=UPI003868D29C
MRLGVLGPLGVWTAEGAEVRVPELKVRALLAHLLAHHGRTVSADRLIEALWGRELPGNPRGALQTKVWQLRRALKTAEPGGHALVVSRAPGYELRAGAAAAARRSVGAPLPEGERDDVARIEARVRTALDASAFDAAYERGAATSVDDLLQGMFPTAGTGATGGPVVRAGS